MDLSCWFQSAPATVGAQSHLSPCGPAPNPNLPVCIWLENLHHTQKCSLQGALGNAVPAAPWKDRTHPKPPSPHHGAFGDTGYYQHKLESDLLSPPVNPILWLHQLCRQPLLKLRILCIWLMSTTLKKQKVKSQLPEILVYSLWVGPEHPWIILTWSQRWRTWHWKVLQSPTIFWKNIKFNRI